MSSKPDIAACIMRLVRERGPGKTICPSEASRAAFGEEAGLNPKAMEQTRQVAAQLIDAGQLEATQRGEPVDLRKARGPVRLRLKG